jgi:hypothetical protein
MYNKVTLWHLRVTILAMKRQKCLPFVSMLLTCYVVIKSLKSLSDATAKQDYVQFAQLSSFKIVLAKVNSTKYLILHVKGANFLSSFNEILVFRHIFVKFSNIKFHINSSTGSHTNTYGQMDGRTDGQTRRT